MQNILDLEQKPLKKQNSKEKKQMENEKLIKILVVGDADTGKTTFLDNQCHIQLEQNNFKINQSKKTKGCDIHIQEHIANIQNLVVNEEQANTINTKKFGKNRIIFQYYDIQGEKNAREYIQVYTKDNLHEFKAIIYFFDMTNLNTLSNFHTWIKDIFHNSGVNTHYNYVWSTPFLLIGTKKDYLSYNSIPNIKKKIYNQIQNMFRCTDGENLLLISNQNVDNIQMRMYSLFLSQLCLESELQKKTGSEYLPLTQTIKKTSQYTLNPNLYYNKYNILDNERLFKDFVQKISNYLPLIKYCQRKKQKDANNENTILILSK